MLLAIDVGNTNIVFAIFTNKKLVGKWRIATSRTKTADEYAIFLANILKINDLDYQNINSVIIASVVPNLLFDLKILCNNYLHCEPMIVDSNLKLNVKLSQENPREVGADLIANAAAAYQKFGGDTLIVDFGTATTFQVIDEVGNYQGQVIAPGVELVANALGSETAKLPKIGIELPIQVIANTTVRAMQSGVYWGYIGLIENIINKIDLEYVGNKLKVITTGGLAPLFMSTTKKLQHLEPDLTMYGLMYIYYMNNE